SIASLSEVIDFYAAGGRNVTTGEFQGDGRENLLKSQFIKGFILTAEEKTDLINFLKTLTDQTFLSDPKHVVTE
ncbi:MAG: di-heme enzyme, partial [Colwellia sp.]